MTPEQIAKSSDFSQQAALFCWCALNIKKYPELKWYYSIQNEEQSGSIIRGARSKQTGKKKGVSDTCLPVKRGNYSGLYIEMKKPSLKPKTEKGMGGEKPEQREFGEFVQSQGYGYVVCWSWKEARDILIQYLEYK